ncbi:MAG: vWA domain-containing protein [Planctomycetota bacterium]|jgi:hypothetical protein
MNLLSLTTLGALGKALAIGAGATAVGALVAMYFLKLKRLRREISSTFLWKKSVHDLHANSPFQRLRKNLLLFLQLLILLAALFGLARPALRSAGRAGVTYIMLIDNSASMSAEDVPGGRLETARKAAKQLVSDMNRQDAMIVLSFASRPKVAQTLTSEKTALLVAINEVEESDEGTSVAEPLELAASLAGTVPNPKIIIISDGGFPADVALDAPGAPVEFIKVGERADNLGVTAMDVRRNLEDPTVTEIFAMISNCADRPRETTVTLEVDGKLVDAQKVTVEPRLPRAAIFKVATTFERLAKVAIEAEDDLPADNSARAVLEPPRQIQAVILGDASPFLRRALTAIGNCRVTRASAAAPPVVGDGDMTVFISEGRAPLTLGRAGYLVLGATPPGGEFTREGVMASPFVLNVDKSHPVTTFLELDDLYIAEAMKMTFPPETKVLVESEEGPLIALSYSGGARVITVTFNPMDSRWPLRISYPMFIANAVNFLASGGQGRTARMIRTGDVLVVTAPGDVEKVTVSDPAGRKTELASGAEGTVAFGDTAKSGVYTVEAGGVSRRYVANLTNERESDTTPGAGITVGTTQVAGVVRASRKNREVWRGLLIFALIVLLVEWYIYNRRVYI